MEKGTIQSYKDLHVWQKSIDLVVRVYHIVGEFPPEERFVLGRQMRRAAVSVPSNIAEGQARRHTAELHTQMILAQRLEFLGDGELKTIEGEITELRKMLITLFNRLK